MSNVVFCWLLDNLPNNKYWKHILLTDLWLCACVCVCSAGTLREYTVNVCMCMGDGLTYACASISMHAKPSTTLTIIRPECVYTLLLTAAIQLFTFIYICRDTQTQIYGCRMPQTHIYIIYFIHCTPIINNKKTLTCEANNIDNLFSTASIKASNIHSNWWPNG